MRRISSFADAMNALFPKYSRPACLASRTEDASSRRCIFRYMQKPTFDPGLTQQFTGVLQRSINKDGSFNVYRRGVSWRDFHPYLRLLNTSWLRFLGEVLVAYVAVNTIFAAVYFSLGPGQLQGDYAPNAMGRFLNDFFFSAHTLTTVGYGNIAPRTLPANILSSIEALTGLLGIALATGLL